ncbi:MAG: hypothetical protein KDA21_12620, partial [Phycisphaerales bacterium]|nr:hypothetical protein [Phycisphaerales bacterium]
MNLAPSIPTPLRSAFTLLELLLAVTVLASVTGLVAVTYSQMNGWVADNGTEQRMMRLHRVLKLMTDQWEDRRTAAWAEGEHRILTGDTGIGFLTATPILFPDWPLVRVAYRIVPTPDRAPGAPETWDLLYEEVRVVELGAPPEDEQQKTTDNARPRTPPVDLEAVWDEFDALPETDAWGNPLRRELTLLTHCTELRIERYGLAADILQEAGLAAPVSQPSRTPGTTGGER